MISPRTLAAWRNLLPDASFLSVYGSTETLATAMLYRVRPDEPMKDRLPLGEAVGNTRAFIITEQGKEAKNGEEGELLISGDSLAEGYYKDPNKTKEVFIQNPWIANYPSILYKTGDWVRKDENGMVVYCGRKDSQVKIRGHRVELDEIRDAALHMGGVYNSVCVYDGESKELVLFYEGEIGEKNG